jgi:hypothetical protein
MATDTMHTKDAHMVRNAWPEQPLRGDDDEDKRNGLVPFAFGRRDGRLDWRMLSSVDPDSVARRGDIRALQSVIDNLTFADMESEGAWASADRNMVKLLKLSQLCIEYLVHTQVGLCSVLCMCVDR